MRFLRYDTDNPGMAEKGRERRRHVRRPVFLTCRIDGTAATGSMHLTDLSESGCFVATSEPLPMGSQVTIYVTVSGGEIPIMGRVVRVQADRGFGVEINNALLSQYSRQTLERLLHDEVSA
jgi:hypothetical protein